MPPLRLLNGKSSYVTLTAPDKDFAKAKLITKSVDPASLVGISQYKKGEPYFGESDSNRFDDPHKNKHFGMSYFGFNLHSAFAETVLHNETKQKNGSRLATSEFDRYVPSFKGRKLEMAI